MELNRRAKSIDWNETQKLETTLKADSSNVQEGKKMHFLHQNMLASIFASLV